MARDNEHNPDPNVNAARIVAASIRMTDPPAEPGLEAAWLAWSAHIQKLDDRTRELLRAAFEAGYDAAQRAGSR